MSLFKMINETIKKEKIGDSKEYIETYNTGLNYFDGRNSMYDSSLGEYTRSIAAGSLNTIIGPSGSGKTTFTIQAACKIVEDIEDASIFHLDFEHSSSYPRILALSGWSKEKFDSKYKILNSDIDSHSFYKLCKSIHKIKTENFDKLKIDTGKQDRDGNPIYELPPTIIVLDSIASMFPPNISDEENLSGQMSATATARENNTIIKRLSGSSTLEKANIIILAINHITKKIEINPMVKTAPDINYLKQDESMPGGTSFPYLSNTLLKITARTKLDPLASSSAGSKWGIKGFVAEFELIKSRSAPAGTKFEVIYSQDEGFLNDLTDLKNLSEAGYVKGSPRAYFFDELPDVKFTNKTFREVHANSPELQALVKKLALDMYRSMVYKSKSAVTKELETGVTITLVNEAEDIWQGTDNKFYDGNGVEIEVAMEE